MDEELNARYKANMEQCPFCKSPALESDIESHPGFVYRRVNCSACDRTWKDRLDLISTNWPNDLQIGVRVAKREHLLSPNGMFCTVVEDGQIIAMDFVLPGSHGH